MKKVHRVHLTEKQLACLDHAFFLGVDVDLAVELCLKHWFEENPGQFACRLIREWNVRRTEEGHPTDSAIKLLSGLVKCPKCGKWVNPRETAHVTEGVFQCSACKRIVNLADLAGP